MAATTWNWLSTKTFSLKLILGDDHVARHHSADHLDLDTHRRPSNLALQHGMGLLPLRRPWARGSHSPHSCPLGPALDFLEFAHVLIGKPVPTFPGHALACRPCITVHLRSFDAFTLCCFNCRIVHWRGDLSGRHRSNFVP